MLPAHQRLEAGDRPRFGDAHQRLVIENVLAPLDAGPDLGEKRHALLDLIAHEGLEDHEAIAAGILGLMQRDFGVAQEAGGAAIVFGVKRRADAGADRQLLAVVLARIAQQVPEPLGGRHQIAEVRQVGDDDGELVAAQPRHDIGAAIDGQQLLGHKAQQRVAGGVPQRIVDVLEMIEIDDQQPDLAAALLGLRHSLRKPYLEQRAVGQPESAHPGTPGAPF